MTPDMETESSRRQRSLLGSVPVITLGLLLVTIAMLKAPWPADPESLTGATVSYRERLQGKQASSRLIAESETERSAAWYGRRILDGLALSLLVAGYIGSGLMILSNEWRVLIGLTLVGIGGTLYGGAVGLYAGPILTTGGFALVLFGAGLSLISQSEREKYDTHLAA